MNDNKLSTTGSPSDIMARFSKLTHASTAHLHKLRTTTIYHDGIIPAKLKVLGAVLWSVSARCEPCVNYYAREAVNRGVTESEFAEFLAVATAMGGCVGETWAVKAYRAFLGVEDGTADVSDEDCLCA